MTRPFLFFQNALFVGMCLGKLIVLILFFEPLTIFLASLETGKTGQNNREGALYFQILQKNNNKKFIFIFLSIRHYLYTYLGIVKKNVCDFFI